MKFSVIVVSLNAGEKLKQTLDSILRQTYRDFEIVVKDGGSTDGSLEGLRQDERIKLYVKRDKGIYDAMNQAVSYAEGEFLLFMNCGDSFFGEEVLEKAADLIEKHPQPQKLVLYGDTYSEKNAVFIAAPPEITGFTCYRNIPCHQSCIYAAELCRSKPYDGQYRIRADYDHFLWCYYRAGARMVNMKLTVASYEGGGYSESRENRRRDSEEHGLITKEYMSSRELLKYKLLMLASLAPLRRILAENQAFSGIYHRVKNRLYQK